MLIVRLAFRNALRNVQRTLITSSMVVLGTAMLVLGLTWVAGVFGGLIGENVSSIGHVRVVDPDYAQREMLMPLYENIADADAVLSAAKGVDGVVAAYPTVSVPVTLTAGEEIGDVFGLVLGAEEPWLREWMKLDQDLVAGTWFTGAEDEIVLGRVLAERTGVGIGEELRLIGQTQDGAISPILGRVVGIVSRGGAVVDQRVFMPLSQVQYLADIEGGATEVLVYGTSYEDAGDLVEALSAEPALSAYAVQPWSEREPWVQMTGLITVIRGILVFVIVLITALGVLNTMMMSVLERTDEIGVMRAMGLSRLGAVSLFVLEAVAIAVLGGIGGVALGAIPAYFLETVGITFGESVAQNLSMGSATVHGDLTPGTMLTAFLLALAMAVVGSALPAIRAASIEPVSAMRSGR